MQEKLLRELVEEMAGVDAAPIVEILFKKKDVNEFLIARKMDMTINQIRNILYKLSADGLVSFIRKKDKRKGWYIYYWTLDTEKCLIRLEQELIRNIEGFKSLLKARELKRYYICKGCNIEVSEETALEHDFSCEECAEVYELSDNSPKIRELKGKITKKEKELVKIREELILIRIIKRKKQKRKQKKEDEEKKKERAKKRLANKKLREKEKKKNGEKKVVKKKVVKKKPLKKSKKIKKVKKKVTRAKKKK